MWRHRQDGPPSFVDESWQICSKHILKFSELWWFSTMATPSCRTARLCSNPHKDGVSFLKFRKDPELLLKCVKQDRHTCEKWEPCTTVTTGPKSNHQHHRVRAEACPVRTTNGYHHQSLCHQAKQDYSKIQVNMSWCSSVVQVENRKQLSRFLVETFRLSSRRTRVEDLLSLFFKSKLICIEII